VPSNGRKSKKVTDSERSEASAFIRLKTKKCRFLATLGMTGPVDFFTPSFALGHSISPLPGLRKALRHEEDFVNELVTQDTSGKSQIARKTMCYLLVAVLFRPPGVRATGTGVIWDGIPLEARVIPAKAGIHPLAPHFLRFREWIPALRQAQGKLFVGMTATCNDRVPQRTPGPAHRTFCKGRIGVIFCALDVSR
jgi:hypothetical protein